MKSVTLPEGLEYVGECCFKESALESITLSSSLKTVEKDAFYKCRNLKSVCLPEGLEKIGIYAFFETALENIVFPASLKVVAQGAFAKCKSLKSVTLNEGLEILGTDEYPKDGGYWYGVFDESTLESITLPTTLKRVEYCTFSNC